MGGIQLRLIAPQCVGFVRGGLGSLTQTTRETTYYFSRRAIKYPFAQLFSDDRRPINGHARENNDILRAINESFRKKHLLLPIVTGDLIHALLGVGQLLVTY